MELISDIHVMRKVSSGKRAQGLNLGFVPTMGSLHEGHLSLIRQAKGLSNVVVVSIFVNPIQFGEGEDFNRYPRNIEQDSLKCETVGVDILFLPTREAMYPEGFSSYVYVDKLTEGLCGRSRPGHFRGVTTVVAKLFNIVQPHFAVFGQKDAQQVAIIKRMVKDLNMDVDIIVSPIIRESDGLALSSRNTYLTPEERKEASIVFRSLKEAESLWKAGERHAEVIIRGMVKVLSESKLASIEYIEVVDKETMAPINDISNGALVALAVWFGKTRLIDNFILGNEGVFRAN